MTDPVQLDAEIKARVAEQVSERAQRRTRMRKVRAQFDRRRRYGKARAHAEKLARQLAELASADLPTHPSEARGTYEQDEEGSGGQG